MKKIMLVFGTRPEAIKMCPLVKELEKNENFEVIVCVTGQHKEMLQQVLDVFDVKPNYNLNIMKKGQTLFDVTNLILENIKVIYEKEKPNLVLVHGDTSTSFAAALAAFYCQIQVGHVEAGLRTYNLESPFPEEFNRQSIGIVAKYHFAPTTDARDNLLREGKESKSIFVTGNTAIDALNTTISDTYYHPIFDWVSDSKMVLLTAHRRENLGEPLRCMFNAIKRITNEFPNVKVIYPIHMNPLVRETANEIFGNTSNVKLIEPLDVIDFHNFLNKSYLVLTDSGGIQEEAPSLGKPVLVMRDTTERGEGVKAGTLRLVGTNEDEIYKNFKELLINEKAYNTMRKASNPYGDGTASKQIADILSKLL
ncbi:MAG: UDP-N-acetylglucosamine 2-epimerase (non-hydrolyzing) [bacterium]